MNAPRLLFQYHLPSDERVVLQRRALHNTIKLTCQWFGTKIASIPRGGVGGGSFCLISIMPKLPGYSKAALVGRQTVAKFREDAPPEAVRLYLVNVR